MKTYRVSKLRRMDDGPYRVIESRKHRDKESAEAMARKLAALISMGVSDFDAICIEEILIDEKGQVAG